MTTVSVLIAAYGRQDLLERNLWLLRHQTVGKIEIVIADDGGEEAIDPYTLFKKGLFATGPFGDLLLDLRLPGSEARPPTAAWRAAYEACSGDYIVTTSPEILVAEYTIEHMLGDHELGRRDVPTLYFLPLPETQWIAGHWEGWMREGVLTGQGLDFLQQFPGFRGHIGSMGLPNYRMQEWQHHLQFSGAYRAEWDRFGWPSNEVDPEPWLVDKETGPAAPRHMGWAVYHQWHKGVLGHSAETPQSVRIARIQDGGSQ